MSKLNDFRIGNGKNGKVNFNEFDFRDKNFNSKKFGNKIKLLSKSFNSIFVDNIDLENYKYFVNVIYETGNYKFNFKLGRKLFKTYKILELCLSNIDFIGKDFLMYLYEEVINLLFTNNPGGMQSHRDIIDMCKKGYVETGYIECYYYLAWIIERMCSCCYKPSNAEFVSYKYYKICLNTGFENYTIHNDLIKICSNIITWKNCLITNEDEKKIMNENCFAQLVDSRNKISDKKYVHERNYNLNIKFSLDFLIESCIKLNKKAHLDNVINLFDYDNIDLYGFVDVLCYYHTWLDDYNKMLDKAKNSLKVVDFIQLMILVNFKLEKYEEMIQDINLAILTTENNFKKKNIINAEILLFIVENKNNYDTKFYFNLVNFYYSNENKYWELLFVLFFDKLIQTNEINNLNDYLNIQINKLENTDIYFRENEFLIAKYFIDGVENISKHLINTFNDKLIIKFKKYLAKIYPYCEIINIQVYTNYSGQNYTNPFAIVSNDDETNKINDDKINDDKIKLWDVVYGEDPDYDIVYPTYKDYLRMLYNEEKQKENIKLEDKIIEINNYIQEKMNYIKILFINYEN